MGPEYFLACFFSLAFVCTALWHVIHPAERSYMFRPSVLFVSFLFVIYLLPSLIGFSRIKEMSPALSEMALMLSATLYVGYWVSHIAARRFWRSHPDRLGSNEIGFLKRGIFISCLVALMIACALYFYKVDFVNTGLFGMICEPRHFVILRELSLKLLGVRWLGYVYLIGFSCLCPFLVVLRCSHHILNSC